MAVTKAILTNAVVKCNVTSVIQRSTTTNVTTTGWNMSDYRFFMPIQTRWSDNDEYGHINNSVYYQFIDTVITNAYFSVLNRSSLPSYPMVRAKTSCIYRKPLCSPQTPLAGTVLSKLGKSSVELLIGFFEPISTSDDYLDELEVGFMGNFFNQEGRESLAKHYNQHAVARGAAVGVHVSKDLSQSMNLPKELVNAFNILQETIDN